MCPRRKRTRTSPSSIKEVLLLHRLDPLLDLAKMIGGQAALSERRHVAAPETEQHRLGFLVCHKLRHPLLQRLLVWLSGRAGRRLRHRSGVRLDLFEQVGTLAAPQLADVEGVLDKFPAGLD